MADEKVYYPEVIDDNPFPGQGGDVNFEASQKASGDKYEQEEIDPQEFKRRRIAHEVIGRVLNTKSKKILGEFEFTQKGAIQIGEYQNGVSGDIKISPSGVVARNESGITTFALDGDTGDATFKGTVQAGSVIATDIDGDLITAGTVSADKLSTSYIEVGGADSDLQTTGLTGAVNVGSSNVKIDGANTRIVINDGSDDRILMGYQSGGF